MMSGSLLNDLRSLRELLSDPKRWTQHTLARNRGGEGINPRHPDATCFCLYGATMKITGQNSLDTDLSNALRVTLGSRALADFNDYGATHSSVLKLIDDTIERLSP